MQQQETGVSVADLCRAHGVGKATVQKWKAKFGGMDICQAKRLKARKDENAKLNVSTHGGAPLGDARIVCRATDELRNETLFPSLADARATLADWRKDCNVERPNPSIGWQTPNDYAATFAPHRGLTPRSVTSRAPAPVAQPAQPDKTETLVSFKLDRTGGNVKLEGKVSLRLIRHTSPPQHWRNPSQPRIQPNQATSTISQA